MSYALQDDKVQEITVEASYFGQQLISRFHYQYSDPTTPLAGNSATLLTSFRTAYRANILTIMFTDYIVTRYRIDQIIDVIQTAAGPPVKFRSVFAPTYDFLAGAAGDVGSVALGAAADYLPAANARRLKKLMFTPVRGYYKAAYHRSAPNATTDLDPDTPDHDRWVQASIDSYTAQWTNFSQLSILGEVGGNGWDMSVWSPNYFGRVVKPLGGDLYLGANKISSIVCMPFVGTQSTRRYKPAGAFRGV